MRNQQSANAEPLTNEEARAQAEREWDSGAVDRSRWIRKGVYVGWRKQELLGKLPRVYGGNGCKRAGGSARSQSAAREPLSRDDARAQAESEWEAGRTRDAESIARSAWPSKGTFVEWRLREILKQQ